MASLKQLYTRLRQSAVAWSWIMNGLRLTSGVVILPLLTRQLAEPDFHMYFGVFLSLSALVPILDMGFAVSIGRSVSYAMGGAKELKAHGFAPQQDATGPNQVLLWQLLHTTRQLYRLLALATLGLLGTYGTLTVAQVAGETSSPQITWIAWGLTLTSVLWEIYTGWWNVFLRNMNRVMISTQQIALGQAVKITLSCMLLLSGAGLLSVPIAGILSSFLQRYLARRTVLQLLGPTDLSGPAAGFKTMVATLWPNSWRMGLQFLSGYLAGQANSLICLPILGLHSSGTYGFSLQLILICSGMAQVWTLVKWPVIGQLRIKQDNAALRRLIWPRVWLHCLTYAALALAVLFVIPALLQWTNSTKSPLPTLWLSVLALNGFLETNFIFWGTLISTENRTPFVWPIIISNFLSFLLVLLLLHTTELGFGALVLSPLAVGLLFNHWKWPREGARSIGTTWWRFMLRRGI